MTEDFAEVLGVHLGDGCLSRMPQRNSFTNVVAFTGHSSEYWYYESFVKPTIETTFGVTGRLYFRNDNTTRYVISSKDLVTYLASLGLPIGKKRDASIPQAVLESGYSVPCIRGIYHAEGSLYHRYSKPYNRMRKVYDNLLSLQFRMTLRTLMHQVYDELVNRGLSCNKLTERDGVYTFRITSQTEILKFMLLVQPKYKNHLPPITL